MPQIPNELPVTVIGLTGGIASGKSTVAEYLKRQGYPVIDADKLGHAVYEPGTLGFVKVVKRFGEDIVALDGTIDRKKLGPIAFADPRGLKALTDIVWPEIKLLARKHIAEIRARDANGIVVLEAAVLLEAGWQDIVDEVWTIVVPRALAIKRAMARDGTDRQSIEARIDAQIDNAERVAASDVSIENDGTLHELQQKIATAIASLTAGSNYDH